MTGTIKRLRADKGFGFIRATGTNDDYFFHRTSIMPPLTFNELREGDPVTFEDVESDKGLRAECVESA